MENRDRILPLTRGVAVFILPFLVVAFLILFLTPDSNGERFAWAVKPRMSAMFLGGTYLTGVFFFTTVALARRWRQVQLGFLPVTTFATLMGIATILHWDRFNHAHIAFWLWAILYFTTPFIVFFTWYWNRRSAAGAGYRESPEIPGPLRVGIGVMGVSGMLAALLLFLWPGLMTSIWPWTLSPLTSRITASEFALFGVFGFLTARERHWDSLRLLLRCQLASPLIFLIAVLISRQDFDWTNPLAWLFLGNLVALFALGVPGLYLYLELKSRSVRGRQD